MPDAEGQAALADFLQEFIYDLHEIRSPEAAPGILPDEYALPEGTDNDLDYSTD